MPRHVETQCEKGIKPLMHEIKRGKVTVTALPKPPPPPLYIYPLSEQYSSRAAGEKGWHKRMKAMGETWVTGEGTWGKRSQKGGRRRQTEWESYGQRQRWRYTEPQSPRGLLLPLTKMI